MNEYTITGRVAQQPKLVLTRNNIEWVNLVVASKRYKKKDDGTFDSSTDFIKSSCWRGLAKYVSDYINVGDLVIVRGHIKILKDFDIQKNMSIYTTELIADKVKVLARKGKSNDESLNDESLTVEEEIDKEIKEYKEAQMSFKENSKTENIEITEEDLPFSTT